MLSNKRRAPTRRFDAVVIATRSTGSRMAQRTCSRPKESVPPGLRPMYGRVSRYGAMRLGWTMDKVGPICRSVEDCAVVLETARGQDGRDLSVVDAPLDWRPHRGLAGSRIGYVKSDFLTALSVSRRPSMIMLRPILRRQARNPRRWSFF
jgi:hypothetical protein